MCQWMRLGCSVEACGRISHIFFVLLALFAWNLDVFPELFVSGSRLALCVATVHRDFWANFFYFPRKVDSDHFAVHTWKFRIISASSIWQSPRASVYVAFGRISHIFTVLVVPDSPRSSHLKNLEIIFYSQSCGGGFFSIEGPPCQLAQDFVDIDTSSLKPSQKQQQQAQTGFCCSFVW